tara:strand:+ start:1068 stop:3164 length:2097 start_codon:yes stop_codon:yes gene_type:complete
MYIPFADVAKQHKAHAIYCGNLVEDGSDKYILNEAYGPPRSELGKPGLSCHYPLTDGATLSATEIVQGATGLYNASGVLATGPAVALPASANRGPGYTNPSTVKTTALSTISMTSPTPDAGNPNPIGLNSSSYSLGIWYRINDTSVTFDPAGDDNTDPTSATLISIQNYSPSYSAKGYTARINLKRKQVGTAAPGYWLEGEIDTAESIPDAGSCSAQVTSDPAQTPWDASMQNTLWHYVVLVVTPTQMSLHIDGIQIAARSNTATFPATPRFRMSVNTTIGASSTFQVRSGQFAYASVYGSALNYEDMYRHFNSMRRPLDIKVNYNENRYSTDQTDKIGGTQISDLDYSPSSLTNQHRHDGRFAHMIRLDSPLFDSTDSAINEKLENHQVGIPRHWELTNTAGDEVSDTDQKYRYNTHVAAGGWDLNAGASYGEAGVTMLCGWEGINSPRSSSYGSGEHDQTVIFDWRGTGSSGGGGINMTWSYSLGTSSIVGQTVTYIVDGDDGFGLSRVGANGDSSVNRFEFYTPYESTTGIDNTYTQYKSTGNDVGKNWTFQAVGVSGWRNGISMQVINPNRISSSNESQNISPEQFENLPLDDEDNPYNVSRMCRNQVPRNPRFLYCNRNDFETNPHTTVGQGVDNCVDQNRYGPMALIASRVSDQEMTRMLRLMHGQPLHRTRPALRGCVRHFQLNAPGRTLT